MSVYVFMERALWIGIFIFWMGYHFLICKCIFSFRWTPRFSERGRGSQG